VTERMSKDLKDQRNGDEDTTEFENFQKVLEQVLSVPKEEVNRLREQEKQEREK
jgi:hypothetical protein